MRAKSNGTLTPPSEGPPLPKSLGIKWPLRKETEADQAGAIPGEEMVQEIPKGMPHFEFDKVSLPRKGWTRVSFKTAFATTPVLTVTGEYREAWYEKPAAKLQQIQVEIPTVSVRYVEVPPVNVTQFPFRTYRFPRVIRPGLAGTCGGTYEAKCRDLLGNWSFKVGPYTVGFMNTLRDRVCEVFYAVGWWQGLFLEWVWDYLLGPQISMIEEAMNTVVLGAVRDTQDRVNELSRNVNNALGTVRDKTNEGLGTLATTTNGALSRLSGASQNGINQQAKFITDQLNTTADSLISQQIVQQWLGLVPGQTITPVNYRNVDSRGFEVYSPGEMTLHYVAIASLPGKGVGIPLPKIPGLSYQ